MDKHTPEQRRQNMRAVGQRDTKPEIIVRKTLHRFGYRFRLYNKKLPGTPDIVLSKHKACIFVHGCFWHHHPGCKRATIPKSNTEFWRNKIEGNVSRDKANLAKLSKLGWQTLVIWECQTKDIEELEATLVAFLR